ncbi:MAG: hypothetical protein F7B20_06865 [Aeropyrum sp.]|nr:hypothetical protein [Aeropyrum sp.]MCE4616078.1 hypothetical protein [Aeropyrum sp.]
MAGQGCVAEIVLPGSREIAASLEPDNLETPSWLRVTCSPSGETAIRCIIEIDDCRDSKRILSMRNTIDDLLRSYKAAVEVLERG